MEAEASYIRALELESTLDDARYNLSALYERQGRGTEGLVVLQPLLDESRVDGDLLRLAARLAIQADDVPRALRLVEESLRLEPGNEESLDLAKRMRSRSNP